MVGAAKDDHIRLRQVGIARLLEALLIGFEGLRQLPFGAGGMDLAAQAAKALWQRAAQPRPQDADHDVTLAGIAEFVLKVSRGPRHAPFPKHILQPHEAPILSLEPGDHLPGDLPLVPDIRGAADEEA